MTLSEMEMEAISEVKVIRRLRFNGQKYAIVGRTDIAFITVTGEAIFFKDYYKYHQHRKLDEATSIEALKMIKAGETIAAISERFDVTKYSVNALMEKYINEYRKTK